MPVASVYRSIIQAAPRRNDDLVEAAVAVRVRIFVILAVVDASAPCGSIDLIQFKITLRGF
jgi:hypothetical protein